jgi:NAD(P) transhydrogenase subunit alpha
MKQDDTPSDPEVAPLNKGAGDDAPLNNPDASVGDMSGHATDVPGNQLGDAMQNMPVNEAAGAGDLHAHADMIADTAAAGAAAMGMHIDPFIFRLTIFVLAIFVGYYVVWSVTPALHTPLMSVTNAISSVIIVGALLAVAVEVPGGLSGMFAITGAAASKWFGFVAVILASVNIFGGFLVTQRMLAMYKKKG